MSSASGVQEICTDHDIFAEEFRDLRPPQGNFAAAIACNFSKLRSESETRVGHPGSPEKKCWGVRQNPQFELS